MMKVKKKSKEYEHKYEVGTVIINDGLKYQLIEDNKWVRYKPSFSNIKNKKYLKTNPL